MSSLSFYRDMRARAEAVLDEVEALRPSDRSVDRLPYPFEEFLLGRKDALGSLVDESTLNERERRPVGEWKATKVPVGSVLGGSAGTAFGAIPYPSALPGATNYQERRLTHLERRVSQLEQQLNNEQEPND